MKPTQEQIKKFWEWCEVAGNELRDLLIAGVNSIDLNNLFKYAVPKLNEMAEDGWDLCFTPWVEQGKYEVEIFGHKIKAKDKDPALALFWALWQVMMGDKKNG